MKKQRSNNKFLKIAAVSLALLALPPLAVYGQTVRCRAAQPRPALPGVMSDEIRLDPVAGALYRYGVQGGINRADSYWSDNVFTVLRGKLKQAAARGLLSREQLDYLLDRVAEHPLVNYLDHEGGSLSNPTAEHFLPLLYVLGAWDGEEPITIPVEGIEMGSLSMLSVVIGA